MLEQFAEPMIDNQGNLIKSNIQFLKMDNSPGMRESANLGPCSCCDFLVIGNDSILFIEETDLLLYIKNSKAAVNYLNNDDKEKFVRKQILHENRSKIYGALLVLCRLAHAHQDVKDVVNSKAHTFWLVVRGHISNEDRIYFDSLRHRLESAFKKRVKQIGY